MKGSLMKKKILGISLLSFVVVFFIGFQIYRQQRIHNIFDEIYYEESDYNTFAFLWKGRAFYKLEGMNYQDDSSDDFYAHDVKYPQDVLPDNLSTLSYYFYFDDFYRKRINSDTELGLDMRLRLPNTDDTINFDYSYNTKSQTLKRYMWYYDANGSYYDQKSVEAFLSQHGKTVEDVRKEADKVMRNKLLEDWCSIYPSHFSPDDWGEVTVKDVWNIER